jgi:hypothetical protein
MAARLAPGGYDQLHHFIAGGVWDAAPLESELLVQADRLVRLEALAELEVGAVDDLFQLSLAFDQRQLPQIVAVEVHQIERDQHDLGAFALQLVLQHGEVGGPVLARHDDLAVDDRRTGADVPSIVGDLPEALGSVIAAPGEDLAASFARWT